ncbi:MFS transporter [Nocardioides bizhenqiangii]|uniref:MFS transporter n=1 Tax=Nocardioides bizhenqiangii TaxID=3095076 RepID=A0ABZ0ZV52_9ACTN|nr:MULTISPECIES: MFS transporter [unclassified Nocardioides]MDZ5623382.1 MFS transporter [Nocardioides sp. HM23]WQQ27706.1 MFS transporter [Nocardioides sp. HM61]
MRGPALAPLRDRRFRWYFASRAVDLLGDIMGGVALVFAVLEVSDSPSAVGIVLAAHSIPMVAFLLVGGVLADRFGRTLIIQLSNVTAGFTALAIAALVLSGTAEIWQLAALTAVNGVAAAANQPALAGLLPQLAPKGALQQANALNGLLRNGSLVVAPAAAGALVVGVGAGWAIAINGATYLLSAALLLPIKLPAPPPRDDGDSIIKDLRTGWGFFRRTTWLWIIVLAFGVLNALSSGGFSTLGPAHAKSSEIGVHGWALILSAGAAGLVVTSIIFLRVPLHRPLLWGMLGCAVYSLQMIALGTTTELWVLLLAAFVGGAGIEIFGLGWELAMQEHVPPDMLSRVYSYDMLGSFIAIPIGQLAFGPLGAAFGLQNMILAAGIAYGVISLLTLASRSVRTMSRAPVSPTESTTSSPVS